MTTIWNGTSTGVVGHTPISEEANTSTANVGTPTVAQTSFDSAMAFARELTHGLASTGTFVNNGATSVTTADVNMKVTSLVIISLNTVGGTVGAIPHIETITAGTGFTTVGTASDTSTYNYAIINPVL